ncbi:hypothetical protein [Phenylobacterium sp. SCN 70-31]|uniref:hypothetical protein n=1 Tax=Phenylobacterium sp. SCN 70-31 TaxID=1660129 RepID=UPI0025E5A36C|nr:hypothetical protein [Phenylobacterium sp. SCN 70-31]
MPLINILFGIMDDRFKGEPKLIGIKYFKNLKEAALFKLANPIVVDLRKPKSD